MPRLIVDGYNIIHAWPELKRVLQRDGLEDARRALIRSLGEYSAQTTTRVTVVFDGQGTASGHVATATVDGVSVRFGSAESSADQIIERLASEASRRGATRDVVVATSDRLQRSLVSAMGVDTISATALLSEVTAVAEAVAHHARRSRGEASSARRVEQHLDATTRRRLERLRRGTAHTDGGADDVYNPRT